MTEYPNMLLVSGTGKKVGKTSLVCALLKSFRHQKIVAIKISPHFHRLSPAQKVLVRKQEYTICEEQETKPIADSSRYLHAGAIKSYYIQVKDTFVYEAFKRLMAMEELKNTPLIIESASLSRYAQPAFHYCMQRADTEAVSANNSPYDVMLTFSNLPTFDFRKQLQISNSYKWERVEQ